MKITSCMYCCGRVFSWIRGINCGKESCITHPFCSYQIKAFLGVSFSPFLFSYFPLSPLFNNSLLYFFVFFFFIYVLTHFSPFMFSFMGSLLCSPSPYPLVSLSSFCQFFSFLFSFLTFYPCLALTPRFCFHSCFDWLFSVWMKSSG